MENAAGAWAPIIDTHVHIFDTSLPLVADATNRPKYDFSADDLLATFDREGVLFGVLTAPSFLGTFNDYALAALKRHRRLRATVILEPDTDPRLMRDLADAGVVGVRFSLRSYKTIPDLAQADWQRFLRRVRDLDWYVHVLAETERNAVMVPLLDAAGVKLVLDHYAKPEHMPLAADPGLQATLRAVDNGRTWVKISAPYRCGKIDFVELTSTLLARAGTERLLWGSDCPWVAHEGGFDYRDTIRWFEEAIPDRATREAIGRTGLALNRFV